MAFIKPMTRGASLKMIPEVKKNEAFGPWWYNLTLCRNESDLQPAPPCSLENVRWPIIHSAGWWDIFQSNQLRNFVSIRSSSNATVREKHVLIVDPLGHCNLGGVLGIDKRTQVHHRAETINAQAVAAEVASEYFKGNWDGRARKKIGRINLYVMSGYAHNGGSHDPSNVGNFWTSLNEWPVPTVQPFYIRSSNALAHSPPTNATFVSYTYNPMESTPMLGGNNLPRVVPCRHTQS